MTTAFELASTNVYQPWNINQVGEAYAVYNAHSRASAAKPTDSATILPTQQDTADISAASATLAASTVQDDSRAARIAALRQSIADGAYDVSSYRVATSIIQSLL